MTSTGIPVSSNLRIKYIDCTCVLYYFHVYHSNKKIYIEIDTHECQVLGLTESRENHTPTVSNRNND
jgi:hypothetical protein